MQKGQSTVLLQSHPEGQTCADKCPIGFLDGYGNHFWTVFSNAHSPSRPQMRTVPQDLKCTQSLKTSNAHSPSRPQMRTVPQDLKCTQSLKTSKLADRHSPPPPFICTHRCLHVYRLVITIVRDMLVSPMTARLDHVGILYEGKT